MKADQRHQLQTNSLAQGITKLATQAKSSSGMIWGILALVVVVGLAYWWWTGRVSNNLSETWISYWNSRRSTDLLDFTPVPTLQETAERFKGTAAENAAKLTEADQLYEKAYTTLFRKSAQDAREIFEKASSVYESLGTSSSATRDVAMRALIGAARCQESMGEIERARHFYQEVVSRFASDMTPPGGNVHPLVADAQERLKLLAKGGVGLSFYAKNDDQEGWPHRVPKTSRGSTPPALPEMPPLRDVPTPTPPAGP